MNPLVIMAFFFSELALGKEWYDLSSSSQARQAGYMDAIPDPFKANQAPSQLRRIPTISNDVRAIQPDVARVYAIQGWGKDLCASSLILLFRMGMFTGSTIQSCLDHAFVLFKSYCSRNHKTTSITHFSLLSLKMERCPDEIRKLLAWHNIHL